MKRTLVDFLMGKQFAEAIHGFRNKEKKMKNNVEKMFADSLFLLGVHVGKNAMNLSVMAWQGDTFLPEALKEFEEQVRDLRDQEEIRSQLCDDLIKDAHASIDKMKTMAASAGPTKH